MWISRRHLELLEREVADYRARCDALEVKNQKLVDAVFSVHGMPAPFQEPSGHEVVDPAPSWEKFRDDLEAAEAAVGSGN